MRILCVYKRREYIKRLFLRLLNESFCMFFSVSIRVFLCVFSVALRTTVTVLVCLCGLLHWAYMTQRICPTNRCRSCRCRLRTETVR